MHANCREPATPISMQVDLSISDPPRSSLLAATGWGPRPHSLDHPLILMPLLKFRTFHSIHCLLSTERGMQWGFYAGKYLLCHPSLLQAPIIITTIIIISLFQSIQYPSVALGAMNPCIYGMQQSIWLNEIRSVGSIQVGTRHYGCVRNSLKLCDASDFRQRGIAVIVSEVQMLKNWARVGKAKARELSQLKKLNLESDFEDFRSVENLEISPSSTAPRALLPSTSLVASTDDSRSSIQIRFR
ncbi:hypothetical protein AXF42_Ash012362 [Apostasia shenzhenica]|uniref:Uncharacterized protein n=1 Tax=Apostasia shenzhenica TaxID=1088818 RepID=A0A2I0ACZ8_9ASPA|nr:hypothetical protein AXF42_Ash012362 [Apostasia shenzhenica]